MSNIPNKNSRMPSLISLLFEIRTRVHKLHLQSKSYAQHVTLGSYYEDLLDLTDSLAEDYQGRYGIISSYPDMAAPSKDPVKTIEYLRTWIDTNRSLCSDESEHQNKIDEIQSLNNATLYKLKNLF